MGRTCLQCGIEIRLGGLCAAHSEELATSEDFTAEQIIARSVDDPAAWLIDQWGTAHPIAANTAVGRSPEDCTLAILHHTVSSRHAQFLIDGVGKWQLVDRGSLNGTFVRGIRVRESALKRGDRIGFGDVSVFFAPDLKPHHDSDKGPGRTVRSKQQEVAFSAVLAQSGRTLELHERPGGGVAQSADQFTVEFARLEFALLIILAERRQEVSNPELAYVSSRELAEKLAFRSQDADSDNVRELIRRVRKKFQAEGIDDLIESRQGVGYRLAWPLQN